MKYEICYVIYFVVWHKSCITHLFISIYSYGNRICNMDGDWCCGQCPNWDDCFWRIKRLEENDLYNYDIMFCRSEERRVGKECRSRGGRDGEKEKKESKKMRKEGKKRR